MARPPRIDKDLARYALQGIEAAIEKLQRQAADLRRTLGVTSASRRTDLMGGVVTVEETASGRFGGGIRKRTMSAEARKRISDAQKARWARHRGQGAGEKSQPTPRTRPQPTRSARKKK